VNGARRKAPEGGLSCGAAQQHRTWAIERGTGGTPPRASGDAPDDGAGLAAYLSGEGGLSGADGEAHPRPLFLRGDAAEVLRLFPAGSADCVLTSPPYFGHRRYAGGGIGAEGGWQDYVAALGAVTAELVRVLRPTGSLWLNLGDTYRGKRQLGIPWRVAFHLADEQGWTLRNSVVWHKVKGGPDTSRDKLRNVHELLFHFVRRPRGYHYDADAVRNAPRLARVENGVVVSATGVSGVRYRRQIELSTALSELEKAAALAALDGTLGEVRAGRLADFRMVIRGRQRATHSDVGAVSGRARELEERGFYFLRYHPGGSKPGDVWAIMPEDTQGRGLHFAPFPADLCRIPVLATCPVGGVVLDPFCGTGTAMLVASQLGRRSVGIDLAEEYLAVARERAAAL
jgi:site-specific DNA-methyltransferase (adenine-specific)